MCSLIYVRVAVVVQNSDVRQMYMNAQAEWLNHLKVSSYWCTKVHVRHTTKVGNFFAQLLCCMTKLPIWLGKLLSFWWVAQLIFWIETVSILRQFLPLSLSCDWSVVCLNVSCWFVAKCELLICCIIMSSSVVLEAILVWQLFVITKCHIIITVTSNFWSNCRRVVFIYCTMWRFSVGSTCLWWPSSLDFILHYKIITLS